MANANRFFLNALDHQARQVKPPDAGQWSDDALQKDFLSKYAAAIKLDGHIENTNAVHSVPSVFARPIQFYQALKNTESPLHRATVAEWRGLMACFAFQKWYNFSLRAREFSMAAMANAVGNALQLGTILKNQLPKPAPGQTVSDWDRWWLLYCGDQLIGATCPWTLVYTPAQYNCPVMVPWRKAIMRAVADGPAVISHYVFQDPLAHFDRDCAEAGILRTWVRMLIASQNAMAGQPDWGFPVHLQEYAQLVAGLLGKWDAALEGCRATVAVPSTSPFLNFGALPDAALPYEAMLVRADVQGTGTGSNCLIDSKALGNREVLALSRTRMPSRTRIYDAVSADQVDLARIQGPSGLSFESRGGQPVNVPYVIAEEAFFPEKLVRVPLSADALQRNSSALALPLTPEFFKYFSHADLASRREMLRVDEMRDSTRVTLKIPLKGNREMVIEKEYNSGDYVDFYPISGVAVWPDFYARDWKENFAAYAGPRGDADTLTDIRVAPLCDGGVTLPASSLSDPKQVRIWKCADPPIGFAFQYCNPHSGAESRAGILLRKNLQEPPAARADRAWTVAVDFGTSSTAVMYSDGNNSGVLRLNKRLVFLTAPQDTDAKYAITRDLYPAEDVVPPFRTLLYKSEAAPIGGDAAGDYTVRFSYIHDEKNEPVKDVKWGSQNGGAIPLTHYLRGLVRYIVCEARGAGVGSLNLKWSYPLSLPATPLKAMQDFWRNGAMGFSTPDVIAVQVTESVSESAAICRCLAELGHLNVRADGLTIAIDVGGGSTDVGLWSARNLVDQFSFKLAGNDILNPRWVDAPGFLAALYKICENKAMPPDMKKYISERASIYFNHLLSAATNPDPRRHPVPMELHGGIAHSPPWVYIRSAAYLFFMGVTFYTGLHTRKRLASIPEIKIYFGGRGASLLDWLTGTPETAEEILHDAFIAGLSLEPVNLPKVSVSFVGPPVRFIPGLPALKLEVAQGLLCRDLRGSVRASEKTFVGEKEWSDASGNPLDWFDEVTLDRLAVLKPPANHDSGYIAYFLTEVLKMHPELGLDKDGLGALKVVTTDVQDCIRKSTEDGQRVLQPVFAAELKTLMDQYVRGALSAAMAATAEG
jgi:hypothetical protein